MKRRHLPQASAAAAALFASAAVAQEKLPDIDIGHTSALVHASTQKPQRRQRAAAPQRTPVQPAAATAVSQREAPVTSSSTRDFSTAEVLQRSYSQPAEALEITPGLIVAQHSGAGKANQFFLRGFALDHGYDISTTLDGLPINQGSHVHSNGYNDANFLIPELFKEVDIRKGPYFADEGVFSSVGAINIRMIDEMRQGYFSASGGSFGYGRLLGVKSWGVGQGELLAALELNNYNGPWLRPDEQQKINGVARYTQGTEENSFSVTAMAYSNHWYATDQIPQRAVDQGVLSRFDTLDPSDGGNATRYSLTGRWSATYDNQYSRIEAYASRVTTNLYDNFTYDLVQPFDPTAGFPAGYRDQNHQYDRRSVFGFNALHGWKYTVANVPAETRVGAQTRYDEIRNGFGDSFLVRDDYIKNFTHALWTDTTLRWTPWFRTTVGLRVDYVHGSVNTVVNPLYTVGGLAGTPSYIGTINDGSLGRVFTSPKGGFVLGPFPQLANSEFFANFGEGLREEDIRGAIGSFNPATLDYAPRVQLLTKTRGVEGGVRARPTKDFDTTLSLFWQDFDAENTFSGDSGTTQYGRPGRRLGFEWTGKYAATSWLRFTGEVTGTHARFRGPDLVQAAAFIGNLQNTGDALYPFTLPGTAPGNYLSLAPVWVAKASVELGEAKGWFGLLQFRYFGARPLTEDGWLKSPALATLNARAGYRFDNGLTVQIDAFNIANSRSHEIDYAYGSYSGRSDPLIVAGYTGGSSGIQGLHFKPVDPPAVRATISGPLTLFTDAALFAQH